MRAEAVELRRVRLPLAEPFRASWGTQHDRDVLLVRALADGAEGWAECAAMNEPRYSPEWVDGAHALLRAHAGSIESVVGNPMAKAALRDALLDLDLRAAGTSLAAHVGAVRTEVDAGVAVGTADSVAELLDTVARRVDEGYRRVKLKIAPGWDVEPVRAVRERFPDLPLQVDANGAYRVDDAAHLVALDDLDLLLVEQPLPDDDLLGHATLAQVLRTPICLDEAITSVRAAKQAITLGACSVVNLKPGRVGGVEEARRIHDVCVDAAVAVWVGGMLATGIGRAVDLALAALPGCTLPGDLSPTGRWFADDLLTEPVAMVDGRLPVPQSPVDVRDLSDVTTSVELVRLSRGA